MSAACDGDGSLAKPKQYICKRANQERKQSSFSSHSLSLSSSIGEIEQQVAERPEVAYVISDVELTVSPSFRQSVPNHGPSRNRK